MCTAMIALAFEVWNPRRCTQTQHQCLERLTSFEHLLGNGNTYWTGLRAWVRGSSRRVRKKIKGHSNLSNSMNLPLWKDIWNSWIKEREYCGIYFRRRYKKAKAINFGRNVCGRVFECLCFHCCGDRVIRLHRNEELHKVIEESQRGCSEKMVSWGWGTCSFVVSGGFCGDSSYESDMKMGYLWMIFKVLL